MSDQNLQLAQSKLFADVSSAINSKPTPVRFETVEVDVTGSISDSIITAYVIAIRSAIGETSCHVDVTPMELRKYIGFLLINRVASINGQPIDRDIRYFKVPCVLALALAHLGRCTDTSLGITLVPSCVPGKIDSMSFDDAKQFSETVLSIAELGGLKCVQGLPRSPEGHLDTMYFTWASGECLAHKTGLEIGAAALSCFFKAKHIETLVMPRVIYGYGSELEAALRSVIINS